MDTALNPLMENKSSAVLCILCFVLMYIASHESNSC